MSRTRKTLLVVGAAFGLCLLGWVALVGAVYAWGGVLSVRVDNPAGPDLSLPVPLAVVDVAMAAGGVTLEHVPAEIALEIREYAPMLRELVEVIEDCPDVVFVEVEDRGDEVRISKRKGRLFVEVRERGPGGVDVEVSMPVRSVARLVG